MTIRDVPTLETDRLLLRGHRREDLADCAAMWAEPDVTRFISGRAFSREEAWVKLLRNVGHWSLFGYGIWIVREKASGGFVGEVGLAEFRRDMEPSFEGNPEAGWVLAPRAHNQGFATEAVRAALVWFEAQFGATRTVCLIDPGNLPSLRVAAKCGYTECLRTMHKGKPTVVLERHGAATFR
jgi:RimJ/RimL family protein N-acetyltransferase